MYAALRAKGALTRARRYLNESEAPKNCWQCSLCTVRIFAYMLHALGGIEKQKRNEKHMTKHTAHKVEQTKNKFIFMNKITFPSISSILNTSLLHM